jgi:hypothetical protein
MLTGNKGEWSEIYALLKLIADGQMQKGDSHLIPIPSENYKVVALNRTEKKTGITSYTIEGDEVKISNSVTSIKRSRSDFEVESKALLQFIKSGDGTFPIPQTENFMEDILTFSIKAKSQEKTDIKVEIHDHRTNILHARGFSIKSQLGGPSTLLNASSHTTFLYRLDGLPFSNKEEINHLKGHGYIKKRIQKLDELQKAGILATITAHLESKVFNHNLILIDDALPDVMASLLLSSYKYGKTQLSELLPHITADNPRGYSYADKEIIYREKIKRMLVSSALGMKPATTWTGKYDANGGYLIILNSGEIISYHIFDKEDFENYLFFNTRIETPSPSRYGLGEVFSADGTHYIRLGLQIRFTL